MRKALSWSCFWLGDFASKVMEAADWTAPVLYPVYNWLMSKSSDLQVGDDGPWEQPKQ